MKWTALLAVAAFLLAVGSASAAPTAIKGTVVAKRAHAIVLTTGRKGLAVRVRVAPGRVRLGDRVSVVGKRLSNGTIRASRLRVLSNVRRARIRGMVVKRLAHSMRVASGHSVLTIHTRSAHAASRHDGEE
jgi:RNase P/RNase MRP subunit p29